MKIEVIRRMLERNDHAAQENRERFDGYGVLCVNLLGGAGSGKTTLLEMLLPALKASLRCAVLEGDLATTRDAERVAALGVPVVQLLTDGGCHLTAAHVARALERINLEAVDVVFIENVGNPICPANFDLGEHLRLAVLSVTEGSDKPAKYPFLFKRADVVLITKCDLEFATNFDSMAALDDLHRLNATVEVIRTDSRAGRGIDRLATVIRERLGRLRAASALRSPMHVAIAAT